MILQCQSDKKEASWFSVCVDNKGFPVSTQFRFWFLSPSYGRHMQWSSSLERDVKRGSAMDDDLLSLPFLSPFFLVPPSSLSTSGLLEEAKCCTPKHSACNIIQTAGARYNQQPLAWIRAAISHLVFQS